MLSPGATVRTRLPGRVAASCEIVGLDANGNAQRWASPGTYTMVEGATAADLTEQVFAATGLKATIDRSYGWYLSDITSPFDDLTLAWNQATGNYWRLFVNGAPRTTSPTNASCNPAMPLSGITRTMEHSLPDLDDVVTDPDAPRPSYDADWPGFGGDGAVEAPTPTQSAEQAWSYDFREGADGDVGVSEPLIVNGDVYLVVNGELRVIDASTGTVKKNRDGRELRANVGGRSAYRNRPVYTEGVVIAPSDDGSLAAFTADELVCVWKTKPLEADGAQGYQSLSSLTVSGSYVFAAFTTVGAGSVGTGGVRLCVDVRDGSVRWLERDEPAEQGGAAGYYWAGAAVSGADLVVGNDAGLVQLVDGGTGRVKATVDVGAPIRAGVVALPGSSRTRCGRSVRRGVERRRAAPRRPRGRPAGGDGLGEVRRQVDLHAGRVGRQGVRVRCRRPVVRHALGHRLGVACRGAHGARRERRGAVVAARVGAGRRHVRVLHLQRAARRGVRLPVGRRGGLCAVHARGRWAGLLFASVVADGAGNLYYTNDAGRLFALKGLEGVQVTFDVQGGSFVPSAFVALGKPVLQPADPVRSGYTFAGWFSDKACTTAWDFATPVDSALTLYAKWEGASGQQGGSAEGEAPSGTAPGSRTPLGGAPAAAHAPLVQEAAAKAQDEKAAAAKQASTRAGGASAATAVSADSGAASAETTGGANPWAVGGIAVGVAGLAGAVAYALLGRRRPDAPAPRGKGRS